MDTNSSAKATVAILILLSVLAIAGFVGCIAFGTQTSNYVYSESPAEYHSYDVVVDSGLNGGAIGCGIFGAVALYGFVKVFLAKTN